MQQKKYALAKPYCIKASENGHLLSLVYLGSIYTKEGCFDQAEQCFLKAIEKKSELSIEALQAIYAGLGGINYAQGKLESAKEWCVLSCDKKCQEMIIVIHEIESNPDILQAYYDCLDTILNQCKEQWTEQWAKN